MKIRKQSFICYDGPWAGHTLCLASPSTLIVNCGGRIGRYRQTYDYRTKGILVWEPM